MTAAARPLRSLGAWRAGWLAAALGAASAMVAPARADPHAGAGARSMAAPPAARAAVALDLNAYRERLEQIAALLEQRDSAGAAAAAQSLLDEDVTWDAEELDPDPAVLQPIADGADTAVRAPLRQLIEALPREPAQATGAQVDAAALEALKARQDAADPRKGLALPGSPVPKLSFAERLIDLLSTSMNWIADRFKDLWDWLKKWFPKRDPDRPEGSSILNPAVFALVGAIVGVVIALAIRAARRAGAPPPIPRARAKAADADADPLSRSANEWEDRARALGSEGRAREAIRAWYHALLVASFRAGALHHRRGRTNWEYARTLGEVGWRGPFVELTGRFDLEWYGRAESTAAALETFAAEAQRILAVLQRPA